MARTRLKVAVSKKSTPSLDGRRMGSRRPGRQLRAWYLVALVAFIAGAAPLSGTAAPNPIVVENQQPGTTSWQFTNYNKAMNHEIEGYASLTSVDKGDQISFMVSLSASAQYNMDFYRMGWYPTGTNPDGTSCAPSCGGRLMMHVGPLNGFKQADCPTVTSSTDTNYGMIECNWTPSYTLTVPTTWTQGVYIVKLTRLDGTQLQNYMTFVARDDSSTAPVLYSLDTNTWQAYNYWGGSGNNNVGISLYGRINDVTQAYISDARAYTVSFDRPYLDGNSLDGAGNFFVWDFPMVRWMESQGYDMTYVTDTELETNPNLLLAHRVFVNVGHDEYYSDGMKSSLQNGVDNGANLAFFSANNVYSRVTWSSNGSGAALRRIHDSKNALHDGTTEYRYLTPPQPENALVGVMTNGVATARPFLVYDATSWIYAGTGLVNYTGDGSTGVITSGPGQNALPGIVGYEFDSRAVNVPSLSPWASFEPPGVQQVGHSFVPASDNGVDAWADATLYTAAGGGTVFSAGTIQWSFTVDDGYNNGFCNCNHHVANAAGQKITSNILARFGAPPTPTPLASLSPTSLTFASTTVGTTSAAQTVTLTNTGTAPMTVSNIGFSGADPTDYTQTNTCPLSPSTLAAGSSCTVSVSFAPTATGPRTANLAITDDAPASPQTVAVTGTGAAGTPGVTLTPTSLTFASQALGTTSAAQTSTLTNTGTGPLTITSIAMFGTNSGDYAQTNTCPVSPATLAAGANCTISVTFTPTATGSRTANLSVTDDADGSPQTVPLTGSGNAPAVTLTPTSLTFASQTVGTTSAAQTATLTNSGAAPLAITGIAVAGANAGDFAQTNTCPLSPATLGVNATCTISVTFSPGASGSRSAGVSIADNATDTPQSLGLSGTGSSSAPAVTLTPPSLSFGSQQVGTGSSAQSTTLQNTGTAPLTISAISTTGTNAADYTQSSNCPTSPSMLAVNATCTISVIFRPTAAGTRTAAVSMTDNASNSPQTIALTGTGTAPAVTLTPTSLAFGSRAIGTTSAAQTTTLTNSGTAPLVISSVGITGTNASDYAQANTCPVSPATLAANATCTISVTFSPSATGSRTASVTISDSAANTPQTVALSGTGTNTTAIAFDKNLGSNGENVNSATMTLTTSATAAPNTRVFLFVDWNHGSRTLSSVSGGGLTWSVDVQARDQSRNHGAIASANAPAGLPAGTVITATFSGSVLHGLIAAASFTGIVSTNPLDATARNIQRTGVAWTCSVTTTNPNDLVVGWSGIDGTTTSTPTAPNVEIHDVSNSVYSESDTSVYQVASTSGSKTVNGTWANMGGSSANMTVAAAYKGG